MHNLSSPLLLAVAFTFLISGCKSDNKKDEPNMTTKTMNEPSGPEWQKYETIVIPNPLGGTPIIRQGAMLPPYGDDPRDQAWIKAGFNYYKKK